MLKKTGSLLSPKGKSKGKSKGKKTKKPSKEKVEKEPEPVIAKKVVKSKGWTITRDLVVQGKVGVRVTSAFFCRPSQTRSCL